MLSHSSRGELSCSQCACASSLHQHERSSLAPVLSLFPHFSLSLSLCLSVSLSRFLSLSLRLSISSTSLCLYESISPCLCLSTSFFSVPLCLISRTLQLFISLPIFDSLTLHFSLSIFDSLPLHLFVSLLLSLSLSLSLLLSCLLHPPCLLSFSPCVSLYQFYSLVLSFFLAFLFH